MRTGSFRSTKYVYGETGHAIRRFLLRTCLFLVVLGAGVGCWLYSYVRQAPSINSVKLSAQNMPCNQIFSADNQVLYTTQRIKRETVGEKQIKRANNLTDALLSIEDRDFFHESGVNYQRTAIAVIHNLINQNLELGGSTLTQQLVKQTVFSTSAKDKTIARKVQEIYLAERLNQQYTKYEILTYYINKVYLGNGLYGMQTAARYYFGRSLDKLSITQSALLAGLVQAPSAYEPYQHAENALWRRNLVLEAMQANHKISQKQLATLRKRPLKKDLIPYKTHQEDVNQYDHDRLVSDSYLQGVFKQLEARGIDITKIGKKDLTIKVPMRLKDQQKFNDIISQKKYYPNELMQIAVTAINNETGEIIAQYGGRNQTSISGFNRAISSKRSTGSSIKPLLDYAPVFDRLKWGENTTVNDTPLKYSTGQSVYNWDHRYYGRMSVQRALYLSRNIPAIRAFQANGLARNQQVAKDLGFSDEIYEASAIGVNASPLQMASAYTALAKYGVQSQPAFISSIQCGQNRQTISTKQSQRFKAGTAYMLTDALKHVPSAKGTAVTAQIKGLPQAGKTGTIGYAANLGFPSNALTDAWYVGYTRDVTIAVWTGYDDQNDRNHYLKESDAKISQQVYKDLIKYLNGNGYDHKDWYVPSSVIKRGNGYEWK